MMESKNRKQSFHEPAGRLSGICPLSLWLEHTVLFGNVRRSRARRAEPATMAVPAGRNFVPQRRRSRLGRKGFSCQMYFAVRARAPRETPCFVSPNHDDRRALGPLRLRAPVPPRAPLAHPTPLLPPPPHANLPPLRRSASVWDAPPTARWCASWSAARTSPPLPYQRYRRPLPRRDAQPRVRPPRPRRQR